jgi:murein DD-endopeptidase MepM/ murein hydrolase activator NlpD
MRKYLFTFALVITLTTSILALPTVQAQTGTPTPTATPADPPPDDGPVNPDIPLIHIVQDGETLTSIAEQYGTTVEILQQLNNIVDPSLLYAGQELLIPGGGGETVTTIHVIQVGDTLATLAVDYNTTAAAIAQTNRLIQPENLVAGQSLTIFSRTGSAEPSPVLGAVHVVQPGDTLLTVAAQHGLAPAVLLSENDLSYPGYLFPGQRLRLPGDSPFRQLTGAWERIRVHPLPAVQGQTVAVYVESAWPGTPSGQFAGQTLRFVPYQDGFAALVGLDAFTEPGRYLLELTGSGDRPWQPFGQEIAVISGNYGTQYITIPEELSGLLDPDVRVRSEATLATVYNQFTDTPQWEGLFQLPVTNTVVTAPYGDARSYNEGPIEIYHTGVDFSGVVGTPIYAPAAGTVVFSDTLELHGRTLIVDHGLGVMTGYYHLSRILVQVGSQVVTRQIIAQGGSTGLSSGPHLHWDLRVMNVPVNALQWTEELFP